MIPEIFQSPEPTRHFEVWVAVVGIIIVLLGMSVGVEIRVSNEDEDK